MTVLGKLWRLSWMERGLVTAAVLCLGAARLLIVLVPFRRLAPILGRLRAESPAEALHGREEWLRSLKWAIAATSDRLPWRCLCLEQAVAAALVLRWSGIPYTLYLGTARVENGLAAHAWLRAGDLILTGSKGRKRFAVVSTFSPGSPAEADVTDPGP